MYNCFNDSGVSDLWRLEGDCCHDQRPVAVNGITNSRPVTARMHTLHRFDTVGGCGVK